MQFHSPSPWYLSQKQQLRGTAWEWGYTGFTKGCMSLLINCKLYMWVWLICQKGVGLSNYSIALASKRRSFETTGKIWVEYISSRTSISAGEQDNLSGKFPSKQLLPFMQRPLDEALIRTGLCALFRTRLFRECHSRRGCDQKPALFGVWPLTALIAMRAEERWQEEWEMRTTTPSPWKLDTCTPVHQWQP